MTAGLIVIAFSIACSQAAIACRQVPDRYANIVANFFTNVAICAVFLTPVAVLLERLS